MNLFLSSLLILNLCVLSLSQEYQQEPQEYQQETIPQENIEQEPIFQASAIGLLQSINIPKRCTDTLSTSSRCSFGELIMDLNSIICRPSVTTRPTYTNPIRPLPAGVGCIARPVFTDVLYKIYSLDSENNRQLLDSYIKSYSTAASTQSYSTLAVLLGLELRDDVYKTSTELYYPVNSIDVHNNGTHLEIVGLVKLRDYPTVSTKNIKVHKEPDPKLVNRFYNKFINYFSKA